MAEITIKPDVGFVKTKEKPVIELSHGGIQTPDIITSKKEFKDLKLREELLRGIADMGFKKPSKIQGIAIPAILKDPPQNFIGQAQSGTGKTGAFSLSMLSRVNEDLLQPQALCVAPTRELVRQIAKVVTTMAKYTQVKILLCIPEAVIPVKITEQIVIGTPGKVSDLIKHKKLDLTLVRIFVLDEADEMLSIQGQQQLSKKIQSYLPVDCQICLFSATYSTSVQQFANSIVSDPKISVLIPNEKLSLDALEQVSIDCGSEDNKFNIIDEIYTSFMVGQSIIFVHTREKAKRLYEHLKPKGHNISLLYGTEMERTERDRVIDDFRAGICRILITTNVLARGVDIFQVSLVINFDIPITRNTKGEKNADPETYLHRIGRTARFGNSGLAINFVHDSESKNYLQYISDYYSKTITPYTADDLEWIQEKMDKFTTYERKR